MQRRSAIFGLTAAAVLWASLLSVPAVQAAPKQPGLYGPSEVTVGQVATYTSVFKAAPKKKGGCFTPLFTFGDGTDIGGGMWICNVLSVGPLPKPKLKLETDRQTHVFTEPGAYTVTVTAAGTPSGAGQAKPNSAIVKGPRTFTMTVTVNPAQTAVSP